MKKLTFLIIFLTCLDQFFKWLAERYLSFEDQITIIPHFIDLKLAYNKGVSFGFLADLPEFWRNLTLIGTSTIVAIGIYIFLLRCYHKLSTMESLSFAFILSGALGNLYDRIVYNYVIDYMRFQFFSFGFINNLADDLISIGVVLLVISQLFTKKKH